MDAELCIPVWQAMLAMGVIFSMPMTIDAILRLTWRAIGRSTGPLFSLTPFAIERDDVCELDELQESQQNEANGKCQVEGQVSA